MPCSSASDLGLQCLSMSHKKDARLIFMVNPCPAEPRYICLLVCVDALRPCQQFFSHSMTFSCLSGLNQY